MLSERDIGELPSDPAEAFAKVEALARDRLERLSMDQNNTNLAKAQYMNAVIPGAITLELNVLAEYSKLTRTEELVEKFDDFLLQVDRYVLNHRIDKSKRNTQFSVVLDAPTKLKIRHYIEQIKTAVEAIEIIQNKKDEIYKKINALALEIDRTRTRLEI
jgi:hypothetical protein